MKRFVVVVMVLTFLSMPLVAVADETPIPPEANWTPTPPARKSIDAGQLMELLVRKGVLTSIDQSELGQSQVATPTKDLQELDHQNGIEYTSAP